MGRNPSPTTAGVRKWVLDSWEDYIDLVREEWEDAPAFIFRGQANAEWPIHSTLDRLEDRYATTKNRAAEIPSEFEVPRAARQVHLDAFKHVAVGRRGVHPPELEDDEWWVLAQHHGLATPLLDWTLSPFVALFFAFEEARVGGADGELFEPDSRAVYRLSSTSIHDSGSDEPATPRVFRPMRDLSPRLPVQSGVHLKMPPNCELIKYVQNAWPRENTCDKQGTEITVLEIVKIHNVSNEARLKCLKLLNKMNISRLSLFPDLDGAADYINALWELDFDTSLGHLPSDPERDIQY